MIKWAAAVLRDGHTASAQPSSLLPPNSSPDAHTPELIVVNLNARRAESVLPLLLSQLRNGPQDLRSSISKKQWAAAAAVGVVARCCQMAQHS